VAVNELGGITDPFKVDAEDVEKRYQIIEKKIRITVEMSYDLDQGNFETVFVSDDNTETKDLTDEEKLALTAEEMLTYERRNLEKGEFTLEEFLSYGDWDGKVKVEIIEPEVTTPYNDEPADA
jgi:hypothetical protein